MRSSPVFHPLLFVAALLAWSVVGAQGLVVMDLTLQHLSSTSVRVWFVAFTSFGAAFWLNVRGDGRHALLLLGAQTVAALAVIATGATGFEGALLSIISGQVPMFQSSRSTVLGCSGLVLTSLAVYLVLYPPLDALASAAGYAGLLGFTATASHIQQRELNGRRELARVHARLEAAQALHLLQAGGEGSHPGGSSRDGAGLSLRGGEVDCGLGAMLVETRAPTLADEALHPDRLPLPPGAWPRLHRGSARLR